MDRDAARRPASRERNLLAANRSAADAPQRRLTIGTVSLIPVAVMALAVALLSTAGAQAAGAARVISPDGLNLRDAPSTTGNVLEVLPYNRVVAVGAGPIGGTWYEVSDGGTHGYVRGDFLDFGQAPAAQPNQDALVAPADGEHLRTGPSTSSAAVTVLTAGTVVHITGAETGDGWYPVQSTAGAGWLDGQYLQPVPPGSGPVRITWYGHEFDGGVLACGGGVYSADDPTVASAVGWPCGTHLHVCANGNCVDVVVKDRGRMGLGAVDLSIAAFQKLAPLPAGTITGTLTVTSTN